MTILNYSSTSVKFYAENVSWIKAGDANPAEWWPCGCWPRAASRGELSRTGRKDRATGRADASSRERSRPGFKSSPSMKCGPAGGPPGA